MLKDNIARSKKTILLLLITALFVFLIIFAIVRPHNVDRWQILVVHSYSETNDWILPLNKGVRDYIRNNRVPADVETVYLDDEILNMDEAAKRMKGLLDDYNDKKLDLIIVCDDEALTALLNSKHPHSYNVPAVFCGVDYLPVDLLKKHTNITGFTTTPDYEKCYQLARQLHGQIDDIVLIAEDSWIGKSAVEEARRQFVELPNMTYMYESYWSYSETDTLHSPRSVVNPLQLRIERVDMLPGYLLKKALNYKPYSFCVLPQWRPFYALLPRMGTAPFMMVNNEGFGDGQIGGYMTPGYNQTTDALRVGIDILNGAKPADYPITASEQYPVFDWEQLQFWKIDLNRLPENSIIPNMPWYVKYQNPLIAIAIITSLFLILFALMMVRLYKREAQNKIIVQKKLEKEQKELDITIDSLEEGVISMNADGVILSINKKALQWLGLDKEAACVGLSVWTLFDIQERDNPFYLKELIKELYDTRKDIKLSDTAYVITRKKKAFSISGSISSLYYDGHAYGSVLSFHDTTDEFAQREYLALSMISGDIFAWRYDQKDNALHFDEAFFQAYNIKDDGSNTIRGERFLQHIHPDDVDEWVKTIKDIYSGEIQKITRQIRMKFAENSDYQWWEYRYAAMPKSTKDSRYKLIGICMSIEEFKKTEKELIRLKNEAEESDHLKGVFLANMSHEVRTPLNAIVGFSSLLIDGDSLPQESRDEFMGIINENCRLLLKLINEILDISRIESGITFRKDPCDLTEIIQSVIEQLRKEHPGDVELIMDVPEEPVTIISDSYRLKQILGNLTDNAFKFTKEGHIVVGYKKAVSEDKVTLMVKDTGIGITPEAMSKIFERFYKSDDFTQGGGLGLPIIDEIVKRMYGKIKVDSEQNKGTQFYVDLPVNGEIEPVKEVNKEEYEVV